jgi:hypothetical protein
MTGTCFGLSTNGLLRAFIALVFVAGFVPVAGAQQQAVEPGIDASTIDGATVADRYTVELIVFAYGQQDSAGNEVFAPKEAARQAQPDPGFGSAGAGDDESPRVFDDRSWPPTSDPANEGDEGEEQSPALNASPAPARVELQLLEPDRYSMQDIYRKLATLDAYRPILHTAWQQTTQDKAQSPALQLRALGDPSPGLDGTVTLYRGRFIHLDVDLSLEAEPGSSRSAPAADRPENETGGGLLQPPVRYRIAEDRIMRNGEIRYFDHPRFGLIAKVSKVDPGAPAGGGSVGSN